MGIWFVEGFDRETDELVIELELPGLTVDRARAAVGAAPDDPMAGGSYPISREGLENLVEDVPDGPLDWFLGEFAAEVGERRAGFYLPPREPPFLVEGQPLRKVRPRTAG
jgi:hypothetical protein